MLRSCRLTQAWDRCTVANLGSSSAVTIEFKCNPHEKEGYRLCGSLDWIFSGDRYPSPSYQYCLRSTIDFSTSTPSQTSSFPESLDYCPLFVPTLFTNHSNLIMGSEAKPLRVLIIGSGESHDDG